MVAAFWGHSEGAPSRSHVVGTAGDAEFLRGVDTSHNVLSKAWEVRRARHRGVSRGLWDLLESLWAAAGPSEQNT